MKLAEFSNLFPADDSPTPAESMDLGAVLREHEIEVGLTEPPALTTSEVYVQPDGMCDLVAAIEQNTLRLEQCIKAINNLGEIVQFMSDGTRNMFGFFNQIGQDMANMSLTEKVKAMTAMMKG